MNLATHQGDRPVSEPSASADIGRLFHKLNNQLGIVLAHAEMLEEKAVDETHRQHAAQVIASVLDALATSREIRRQSDADGA